MSSLSKEMYDDMEEEVVEKRDKSGKSKKAMSSEVDNDIKKVGEQVFSIVDKYKFIIGLDFSIFLLLFFLIPQIIFEVKPYIWMSLFLVFTILPTVAFFAKGKFREQQILFGIPFFFVCILSIINYCTLNDLYGITSHGRLDRTPAWLDALFVTCIIVFFQYIGIWVVRVFSKKKRAK